MHCSLLSHGEHNQQIACQVLFIDFIYSYMYISINTVYLCSTFEDPEESDCTAHTLKRNG